jgi:heme exporter protein C
MLLPLILMTLAFQAYFVTVLLLRMRTELVRRKLRSARLKQVEAAERLPGPALGRPA